MATREYELSALEAAVAEVEIEGRDASEEALDAVVQAANDLYWMNRKYTRFEFVLVVVHRYESGDEYRRDRYPKKDLEHAEKGLADWDENWQRIQDRVDEAGFMLMWTAHIERREIIEFPWETVGEEEE